MISSEENNKELRDKLLKFLNDDACVHITGRAQNDLLNILNCTKNDIIELSINYLNNSGIIESFPANDPVFDSVEQHLIKPTISSGKTGYIKFQFGKIARKKPIITIVSAHLAD